MDRVSALRVDGVAGMINEVKESATRNGLKMPDENEYRVSKTPARYRQTREAESLQQATYDVRWRTEFYEAVDLVHSELSRRFDQDGMRVAAFREKIAIDAANGKPVAVLDAEALKLPTGFDLGRLQLQLQMLGGQSCVPSSL
ncbi:Gag-Pol polyprotein [Dissostichus eleginoides]|uniref:Gag-Pol polyprotein n=1 Tax=Dissostichus eleginoides TaxID=100907 RepID=A0AAD9CMD5_DISEL|nr:Gag-Pol polyprotein [Dissostichus eleginoides]